MPARVPTPTRRNRALRWAKQAGIMNWGYFIIGLPGETEDTIKETIAFAKKLPLDIALFHVAAPLPGTPFFFEVVENKWFRPGTRWEHVDMDKGTFWTTPICPRKNCYTGRSGPSVNGLSALALHLPI